jgi:hypothetical protein
VTTPYMGLDTRAASKGVGKRGFAGGTPVGAVPLLLDREAVDENDRDQGDGEFELLRHYNRTNARSGYNLSGASDARTGAGTPTAHSTWMWSAMSSRMIVSQ